MNMLIGPRPLLPPTVNSATALQVSLVLEARSWLPDPIGGTLWFAPHAAHTSVYAPFPCGLDELPASYSNASGWGEEHFVRLWA
jgi:dipeptidase